jgi:hypothetical protein
MMYCLLVRVQQKKIIIIIERRERKRKETSSNSLEIMRLNFSTSLEQSIDQVIGDRSNDPSRL